MELLKAIDNPVFKAWMTQSIVLIFFVGGLVLLLIGASLLANSAATLRFFAGMNRWVSMRRVTRPLEIPHDTRSLVLRYRYLFAAVFVVGGIFSIAGLLTQFDHKSIVYALSLQFLRADFAGWMLDSIRWVLVAGNVAGIVVGLMLAFTPGALEKIEAAGSRWFSERQASRGADDMRMKLDPLVVSYPRAAGVTILFIGAVLAGAFGLMLPKVW